MIVLLAHPPRLPASVIGRRPSRPRPEARHLLTRARGADGGGCVGHRVGSLEDLVHHLHDLPRRVAAVQVVLGHLDQAPRAQELPSAIAPEEAIDDPPDEVSPRENRRGHSAPSPIRPHPGPGAPGQRGGSAAPAPDLPHRPHLDLDVGQEGPVALSPQPLVDERAQHHLQAHRALQLGHRLAGEHARPVEDVLGENEQDLGSVLEHRRLLPELRPAFTRQARRNIRCSCYLSYIIHAWWSAIRWPLRSTTSPRPRSPIEERTRWTRRDSPSSSRSPPRWPRCRPPCSTPSTPPAACGSSTSRRRSGAASPTTARSRAARTRERPGPPEGTRPSV